MSLSVTRAIAYNALMTTQVQMNVASANVANADTEGYTRKTANQASLVSGSTNSGASVTSITSSVDKYLLKALTASTSTLGAAETTDSYSDRLQQLMGSVSGDDGTGTSIANSLASLESALLELAETPESETLQTQVVSSLDSLATRLRETSAGIQSLRENADSAIGDAVSDVNDMLNTLDGLNEQIAQTKNAGGSTADLEDQRNTALVELSELMDVTSFVNSSGQLQIYTTSGRVLLDSNVHELSYSPAAAVSSTTTFEAITVDGKDITSQINSGTIGALIEQRDEVLPDVQAELDQLATSLADTLNAVHNQGTALPPPSELTSTTQVSASDAFSGTGTVRFAVVNEDGELVSYQDLGLSAYTTVEDLVTAIDGIDGLTASIDADGHLVVSADNAGEGVAINEMTGAVGSSGEGLSQWLGLNDLVSATGASDFKASAELLADPSGLAVSMLNDASSLTVGDSAVTVGSTVISDQLAGLFADKVSFAAAGSLGSAKTTFAGYSANIIAGVATAAENASSVYSLATTDQSAIESSISSQSGVNIDEETARLSELENLYAAAAQIVSTVNAMFDSLLEAVQSA
jgi:flagellar hook-associated protein 1 FlgK